MGQSQESGFQKRFTTTNGVLTTMAFVPVPASGVIRAQMTITSKDANDAYTEYKMVTFQRVGAANAVQVDVGWGDTARSAGATAWGSSCNAFQDGFTIDVLGAAGKTIDWTLDCSILVNPP